MKNRINKDQAQQIVDTVKSVCGHNINFIDRNGYILASTDPERIGFYHEIGAKVASTGKAIEVAVSDQYTGTRRGINLPIYYNRECIAVVGISGDPEEVRSFGILAQRVTNLLIREQELNSIAFSQAEQKNYIMNALLRQEIDNQEYLDDLLCRFQISKATKKRILRIRLSRDLPASEITTIERYAMDIYAQLGIQLSIRQYPFDYIAVFEDSKLKKAMQLLREFACANHTAIRIAVGKTVMLANLSSSDDSARIAMKAIVDPGCPFIVFDDLALDLILSSVSWNRRKEYLDKTVGKLTQNDLDFLRVYFSEDMSLLRTAEQLYLHKNTVQYKLNRISQIASLNPRVFKDAVLLYIAVCLSDDENFTI